MKFSPGFALGCLSLLLAAALVYEIGQNRQQVAQVVQSTRDAAAAHNAAQTALAELQQQKTALAAKVARQEKTVADLRERLAAAPTPAMEVAAQATPTPAPAPEKKSGAASMGKMLSQMLKDPAMKAMIRSQQQAALKMEYGDLVKQWSLSPDEVDTFYNLLLDKQMGAMDAGQNLLAGKGSAADVAASTQDYETRLKTSLGDDLYRQYQDYQKTVADRAVLGAFQQQLASGGGNPLTPDQSKQLIAVMSAERETQYANGAPGNAAAPPGNGFQIDDQFVNSFAQSQADLNQRVAQQAAGILDATQLDAFKAYQQQILDMQKAGMQMSSKMMSGAKSGGP